MQTYKHFAVQTLRWSAMAGSFSLLMVAGIIASSWLMFQSLVFLVKYFP